MGRNDRGLEGHNEKNRYKYSKGDSSADKVREKTRKELYNNLKY